MIPFSHRREYAARSPGSRQKGGGRRPVRSEGISYPWGSEERSNDAGMKTRVFRPNRGRRPPTAPPVGQ